MKASPAIRLVAASILICAVPLAHAQSRQPRGFEASIGALYQDKQTIDFAGGSSVKSDSDFGIIGAIGYSFNPKLDLIFGFDSADISYELRRKSATTPGDAQRIRTDYEEFAPFLKLNYNFLDRPLTPFVSAGIGWSFIDTNIATGNTFLGCWWDPWWGYFCAPFDETKQVDAFNYKLGVGARWMFNDTYGVRLEYQKEWLNLPRAHGTPDYDQVRLTLVVKYW